MFRGDVVGVVMADKRHDVLYLQCDRRRARTTRCTRSDRNGLRTVFDGVRNRRSVCFGNHDGSRLQNYGEQRVGHDCWILSMHSVRPCVRVDNAVGVPHKLAVNLWTCRPVRGYLVEFRFLPHVYHVIPPAPQGPRGCGSAGMCIASHPQRNGAPCRVHAEHPQLELGGDRLDTTFDVDVI